MSGMAGIFGFPARTRVIVTFIILLGLTACGDRSPNGTPPSPPGPSASTVSARSFTVGVTVSGISGSGLVLQMNSGDNLNISTNGQFVFPNKLPSGAAYAVTVASQPSLPIQICTVANGSGVIGDGNITAVAVTCLTVKTKVSESVTPTAPETHHFVAFHVEEGIMISLSDDNNDSCDQWTGERPGYWRYAEVISSAGGPLDHDAKLSKICWHEYKNGEKTWNGKHYGQRMTALCPLNRENRYDDCVIGPSSAFNKVPK